MNHIDRLDDEYEHHKRHHLIQDELETLVAGLPVSRPSQIDAFLNYVGDALIAVGHSIKKQSCDRSSTTLTHVRGDA